MSTSPTTAIAENRTIFDGRPISEEDLEVTESGEFVLYVAERVAAPTEVHIFPIDDDAQARERVHTALEQLTEDPDVPVCQLAFQPGVDGRLILSVQAVPLIDEYDAGREVAKYLVSAT